MPISIGARILMAGASTVLVTFSLFILFFDAHQRAVIERTVKEHVAESGALASNSIAHWMNGRQVLVEVLRDMVALNPNPDTVDAVTAQSIFEQNFLFAYFGSAQGDMVINPPTTLPAGYDPRQRPWYIDVQEARTTTVTEPYRSASTGKVVMTVAAPVTEGNRLAGVVGGDIETDVIVETIRSLDLGGIGYAFLVNDQGTILVHPDDALTLEPLAAAFPEGQPSLSARIETLTEGDGDTLFAFFPIEGLPTVDWSIGFAIDRDQAFADLTEFRSTMVMASGAAVLVVMGLLGVTVAIWVTRPIVSMTRAMSRLAEGDLEVPVPAIGRRDQIGAMAEAVQVFKTHAIEVERLSHQHEENERRAAAERMARERRRALNELADSFEQQVLSIVEDVATRCEATRAIAAELAESAAESTARAEAVRAATLETEASVESVATATTHMSVAINTITKQVDETTRIVISAVEGVEHTSGTVGQLSDAAQRIGEVVKLIQEIAGQTNLLALNATIEAARAGEAGKGFAVVANEVKALAVQTDSATGDIQAQVDSIQQTSGQSVDEINRIRDAITQVNAFAGAIAESVDQQGAATEDITASVARAQAGTRTVAASVESVTQAATVVNRGSGTLLGAAGDMQGLAERLRSEVRTFIARMREG